MAISSRRTRAKFAPHRADLSPAARSCSPVVSTAPASSAAWQPTRARPGDMNLASASAATARLRANFELQRKVLRRAASGCAQTINGLQKAPTS